MAKSVQDILAEAREDEKLHARMAGYDDGYDDGRADVTVELAPLIEALQITFARIVSDLDAGKIDSKA